MSNSRQIFLDIRSVLSREAVVRDMKEKSDLGRPAVEAVGALLIAEIGDEAQQDPVKQQIGKIVREIMERNGYVWVEKGHQTPDCPLFTQGSIYSAR